MPNEHDLDRFPEIFQKHARYVSAYVANYRNFYKKKLTSSS